MTEPLHRGEFFLTNGGVAGRRYGRLARMDEQREVAAACNETSDNPQLSPVSGNALDDPLDRKAQRNRNQEDH